MMPAFGLTPSVSGLRMDILASAPTTPLLDIPAHTEDDTPQFLIRCVVRRESHER